jgi:lipopolysaccharide/colanic/teichoic acid biosynthesis glycosyltransferase
MATERRGAAARIAAGAIASSSSRNLYQLYGKRCLDIALVLLLAPAAVLVLAVASLVLLMTSGWPVFYAASRVGKDGKPFRMWKLRTMVRDADAKLGQTLAASPELSAEFSEAAKLKHDPRVTAIGRFLRRSSLDELPQLLNVFMGDMSLVGPRPVVEDEALRFGDAGAEILSVRPGVTGPWQVGGRNSLPYHERTRLNLEYVRNASLLRDLQILVRTFLAPLRYNGY